VAADTSIALLVTSDVSFQRYSPLKPRYLIFPSLT
jgi:hypothetical protein